MPCGVQRIRTQPFWSPEGRGQTAVVAYDATVLRLRHLATRWADELRNQLTCPDGCHDPHALRYSVEMLGASGYYSWRNDVCVFHVQAILHAQWVCDPVRGAPHAAPEEELPGEELTGGGIETVDEPIEDQPCTITMHQQDNSTISGIGAFDWNIDLRFEAESDREHDWPEGSCVLKDLTMRRRHGTGVPLADAILDALGAVAGQSVDLTDARHGLAIEEGFGTCIITGTLRRSSGLQLDAAFSPVIYGIVEAVDANGDRHVHTFGPIEPRP